MRLNTALLKSIKTVGFPEPDEVVKESVALFLFQKKLISIGKAAELANMELVQFMELLESLKIPQVEYTHEDLTMDISAMKRLKRGRPGS